MNSMQTFKEFFGTVASLLSPHPLPPQRTHQSDRAKFQRKLWISIGYNFLYNDVFFILLLNRHVIKSIVILLRFIQVYKDLCLFYLYLI
jgi:hypothetical protein